MAEFELSNQIQQNTVDFIGKQLQTYVDFIFGSDTDNSNAVVEGLPFFAAGETATSAAAFLFPNVPADIAEYQGNFTGAFVGNYSIAPNIPPESWVNYSFDVNHSYWPSWLGSADDPIPNKFFEFMSLNENTLYNVEHTANWNGEVYPVYTSGSSEIVLSNNYGITTLLTGSDPLNRYNFNSFVIRSAPALPLNWNANNVLNLWTAPAYSIYNYGNLPKISTQADPSYIDYVQNLPDIQTYEYILKSGDTINIYYNDNTVVAPVSQYYDDTTKQLTNTLPVTFDDINGIFNAVLPLINTDLTFKTYNEYKGNEVGTYYITPIKKINADFEIDTGNYLDNTVLVDDVDIFVDVANWYFDVWETLGVSALLCFVVLSCLVLRKI